MQSEDLHMQHPLQYASPKNRHKAKIKTKHGYSKGTYDMSFKRPEHEKTAMKEKMKKMLQSEEFSEDPDEVFDTSAMKSPLKGSTTFKISANTPMQVESDFCIGGGKQKWTAKASNMAKVSKLFDNLDDDLIPKEDSDRDIIEDADIIDTDPEQENQKKQTIETKPIEKPKKRIKAQAKYKIVVKAPRSKENKKPPMLSPGRKRKFDEVDEGKDK